MRVLALLAASAFAAPSQSLDYFPLQVGNQWIYQSTGAGASNQIIEATGTRTLDSGQTYYLVSGFAGDSLPIRRTADNKLVRLNDTGNEDVLVDFGADTGREFPSAIDACTNAGTIQSISAPYKGPIGQFDETLVTAYRGNCADAGIQREQYLAFVGLLQRVQTSIAGPRVYDLVYARVGGALQVSAPLVSFALSLDNKTYKPGDKMTARLTLRNTQPQPLVLEFSSGQEYDVVIQDSAGKEVYRWSAGKMFAQLMHNVSVAGEKNWVVDITLAAPLPAGKYAVQAWLTTTGTPSKKYSASSGFDVTP